MPLNCCSPHPPRCSSVRRHGVPTRELEDACQDVFVVVFRRLSEFEGGSNMRTWIYGIAVRVALALRRRAFMRRELLSEHVPQQQATAQAVDDYARHEAQSWLNSALSELPQPKREAFVLYELEGMTIAETAAALGVLDEQGLVPAVRRSQSARRLVTQARAAPHRAHSTLAPSEERSGLMSQHREPTRWLSAAPDDLRDAFGRCARLPTGSAEREAARAHVAADRAPAEHDGRKAERALGVTFGRDWHGGSPGRRSRLDLRLESAAERAANSRGPQSAHKPTEPAAVSRERRARNGPTLKPSHPAAVSREGCVRSRPTAESTEHAAVSGQRLARRRLTPEPTKPAAVSVWRCARRRPTLEPTVPTAVSGECRARSRLIPEPTKLAAVSG